MIDYKADLNGEQYKVVTRGDGPCLVLAGAGSGKTRTITYRVAYLLEHKVDPKNILLVTFTNKAAREMMGRVLALTGAKKRLPWSGTFHHIAYRMLRKYAPLLGYQNNFSILDSADSLDLVKLCLKHEGIDRKSRRFPSPKVIQSIISYARNAETTITDVLDLKHPKWLELADDLGRIAEEYRKRKVDANAMDFDDLLVNLHLLLAKSAKVRKKLAEQFQYVLVDEYQDTNRVQASIIRLLASVHKNILVVGDDAQSIYSFRAADIQNILDFEGEYPDARIFRLETNYRSTPDILNLANDVIANNREQYKKNLKSIRDGFTKPEVHPFADQQEEAAFIAQRILELRDEGVPLREMAVLFRAAYHSQSLEVELTRRDIPYEFRGGVRFFERAHIKDALAYLRIFANKDDAIAWSRVLNMQVGIGPVSAAKVVAAIKLADSMDDLSHFGALLSSRGQVGWNDFLQIWEQIVASDASPAGLIRAVIHSKYAEYLEFEHQDYRDRLQDLEQLAIFAENQPDLSRFLAEASMQESYSSARAEKEHEEDEKMVLSTIHQAKGLEWDAVFVLNLANGMFPVDRLRKPGELEEERRLFYVAITRARKYLYLTYPLVGGFNSMLQGPSVFLEELDRSLISEGSLSGGTVWNDLNDSTSDVTYEPVDAPVTSFLKSLDEL